jgi:hypothetical protein
VIPQQAAPVFAHALAQQLVCNGLAAPAQDGAPLLVERDAALPGATLLARLQPTPRERSRAHALYARCLGWYRHEVQCDAAQDDAGLAAAYFALANLAALRPGSPAATPDRADLLRVERQTRHWLAEFGHWYALPLAQQQAAAEQLAIVGVLVVEARAAAQRQGAAARAHVQRAAAGYLHKWLGLAPQALDLGEDGLVVRVGALV